MKPKKSQLNTGCPEALSANCVVWTGANITCLDISNGDRISEVVCAIADKICNICKDIDVSTLDLSCLIDLCNGCPEDRSVKTILQLILDNQCKLQDLISGGSGDTDCCEIIVNMKCLKKFDDFGNEIPQDLNAALQSIVNEVCDHKTVLISLQSQIDDLQDQIDALPDPSTYTEPDITTCLTPVAAPVSEVVPIVTADYCDYKDLVGDDATITQAISQQCSGLNSSLSLVDGWILNPTSLAGSFNNLWIAYCNVLERLVQIEETCCKVDCDSVDIHYQVIDNQDADGISIHFSALYGNKVPSIFTDCGSSITITDSDGLKVIGVIIVSQEGTSQEYDVSGLNLANPLTISIEVKLCSDTITCVKCISTTHVVVNGACAACDVIITGTTGSVTIFYTVNGNLDSVTGSVGDTVYIPKDAINVYYIVNSGDAIPDTSCLTISESTETCYLFSWEKPSGSDTPLDDAGFTRMYLGTNEWALTDSDVGGNFDGSANYVGVAINDVATPLMIATCYRDSGLNRYLIVKVIGSDIPKLRVTNPSGEGTKYVYLYGVAQEDCDCPVDFSEVGILP